MKINKKRFIISVTLFSLLVVWGVGCATGKLNKESFQTMLDPVEKENMFLASKQPKVEVFRDITTLDNILIPRGYAVVRVGEAKEYIPTLVSEDAKKIGSTEENEMIQNNEEENNEVENNEIENSEVKNGEVENGEVENNVLDEKDKQKEEEPKQEDENSKEDVQDEIDNKENDEDKQNENGTEDKANQDKIIHKIEAFKYYDIEYLDANNELQTGYVKVENLVSEKDKCVLEEVMYVRTPTHIYSNDKSSLITLINKGEALQIIGYDEMDFETGEVKWYEVKTIENIEIGESGINEETVMIEVSQVEGKIEGFIRSKYTVLTQETADEVYNENDIMRVHNQRGNNLMAGAAKELDFFPREKAIFENNVMPEEVNALYINSGYISRAQDYIEVAEGTRVNAFVVDIKDNMTPAFPAEAMEKYSPTNFAMAQKYFNTTEQYQKGVETLKNAGFYVIGRITVFKDAYYVKDNPQHAITSVETEQPYKHNGTFWPSAYQRDVWKFNIDLAKEAVTKFGFDEIQFDYIRFPDGTMKAEKNGEIDFRNEYNETKSQAVQRFLMYASDELHELDVYVSGDVFGESAHEYVTSYGQYWAGVSNVLDVISPMSYPDHFGYNDYGFDYPWLYPYELIKVWSGKAMMRQEETPSPAIIRPWIQSHDAIKSGASKKYSAHEISEQLKGYYEMGIDGGYMTWWSSSSIEGYRSEKEAYSKSYKVIESE